MQIAVRLPERELAELDAAIDRGAFPSRAAAVRAGLKRLLREEHDRQIVEAYRRGYGEQPQEDWVGEAGLGLMADFIRREEESTEQSLRS